MVSGRYERRFCEYPILRKELGYDYGFSYNNSKYTVQMWNNQENIFTNG